jgi:hypothetical protein
LCVADFGCGCEASDGSSGSIVSSNGVFRPTPLIVEEGSTRVVDRSDREVCELHPSLHCYLSPQQHQPKPSCIKSLLFRPKKYTLQTGMDTSEISESTPLLRSPAASLPCIRPVIDRLLAQSNTTPTADHILAQFPSYRDLTPSYRTAFVLITLLQIGCDARKPPARGLSLSLWDAWDHHVNADLIAEHCSSHILDVWSNFLRVPKNNADLDALLWTAFPLGEDRCTSVCRMFSNLSLKPDP